MHMVNQCQNCGHVPGEDSGPLANVDATKDECSECGADEWEDLDRSEL
jgi:hypothetical protein